MVRWVARDVPSFVCRDRIIPASTTHAQARQQTISRIHKNVMTTLHSPNQVPSLPNMPPFVFPLLVRSSSPWPREPGPPACLDSRIIP